MFRERAANQKLLKTIKTEMCNRHSCLVSSSSSLFAPTIIWMCTCVCLRLTQCKRADKKTRQDYYCVRRSLALSCTPALSPNGGCVAVPFRLCVEYFIRFSARRHVMNDRCLSSFHCIVFESLLLSHNWAAQRGTQTLYFGPKILLVEQRQIRSPCFCLRLRSGTIHCFSPMPPCAPQMITRSAFHNKIYFI